jgi:hypothetical protein
MGFVITRVVERTVRYFNGVESGVVQRNVKFPLKVPFIIGWIIVYENRIIIIVPQDPVSMTGVVAWLTRNAVV